MKILPQECQISGDQPRVGTRVPFDQITHEMIVQVARFMRLSAGNHIKVQSMNHDYSEVLHEAEFLVVSARSVMVKVTKDDLSEQSVEKTEYAVAQWSPWRDAKTGRDVVEPEKTGADGMEAKASPEAPRRGRPPKAA